MSPTNVLYAKMSRCHRLKLFYLDLSAVTFARTSKMAVLLRFRVTSGAVNRLDV
jgi:hypothetical protein